MSGHISRLSREKSHPQPPVMDNCDYLLNETHSRGFEPFLLMKAVNREPLIASLRGTAMAMQYVIATLYIMFQQCIKNLVFQL